MMSLELTTLGVTAKAKNTGISTKRLRPIVDLVRGKRIGDALNLLKFIPSPAAAQIAKAVKSANANAENELVTRTKELKIVAIYADEGPRTRRFRARARGRVSRITRRNSHITVVVDEED